MDHQIGKTTFRWQGRNIAHAFRLNGSGEPMVSLCKVYPRADDLPKDRSQMQKCPTCGRMYRDLKRVAVSSGEVVN